MKREIISAVFCTWATGPALAGYAQTLLAQGRLDVDTGKRAEAEAAFTAVAGDTEAPAAARAEALVRLGVLRRDAGDAQGSVEAFEQAYTAYGQDKDSLRILVRAVGRVLPGDGRWDQIWSRVTLKIDHSVPSIEVVWPDVPPPQRNYKGATTISFDFKDGNLPDIFRIFADITQDNVVVHPGIGGSITVNEKDLPWDQMLEMVLAPNGYAASLVGNVLEIARPTKLGRIRHFDGAPIDVDYASADLSQCLDEIAATGGRTVVLEPAVRGKVTLILKQVPWDQAFDLLVRLNGLAWKAEGATLRVAAPELRRSVTRR